MSGLAYARAASSTSRAGGPGGRRIRARPAGGVAMDPELWNLVVTTWGVIAVAAGVGIVVFAVEQMLQDLLALRRAFQRREIPSIVRSIAGDVNQKVGI